MDWKLLYGRWCVSFFFLLFAGVLRSEAVPPNPDGSVTNLLPLYSVPDLIRSDIRDGDDEGCRAIDLRSPGESLGLVPTTSQGYGRSNLCGFYSAATMIDAWRGVESSSKTNPIALGIDSAIARNLPSWFPVQHSLDPLSNTPLRAGSMVCTVIKTHGRMAVARIRNSARTISRIRLRCPTRESSSTESFSATQ